MCSGYGIFFLIVSIIIVGNAESGNQPRSKLSVSHHRQPPVLYARYYQSKTTKSYSRRTTTSRPRTTRKYHPITTTPRPQIYKTTRRPTTRKQIITTNPWTTRTTTRRYTTQHSKQPPYNPFWTTTTQKPRNIGYGNRSHTTRQPSYNPFFNTSVRVTTSSRPILITTQRLNLLGQGVGNGSRTTRQPPYNPHFSTTKKPHLGLGNITGHGDYRNHTNRNITSGHGDRRNNTNSLPPDLESVIPRRNQSSNYHPPGNATSGRENHQNHSNRTSSNIGFVIPERNQSSTYHPPGASPGIGFVIPKRNQSSTYHPPGNALNHSKITQRPFYNASNGHPIYPINPKPSIHNNNGYYQPGRGYQRSGQLQYEQPPRVTIVNNNINTQVIYPSDHWSSYGPPASGITIINNNNNYGHRYSHPSYHYSSSDTGGSSLGIYLGYRLGKLSKPSYYYYGTYYENDVYVPRYDHYTVHHYYHERESIPKEAEIPKNVIVSCAGDSGSICPLNTVPLCLNNAAVMCVVFASSTDICEHDGKFKCVKSYVACMNSDNKECRERSNISISIPCISTAKILGNLTIVNNTILIDKTVTNEVWNPLCVTILATPSITKNNTTENKEEINVPFQYTTNVTGSDSLGIYIGQSLKKLEYPSYIYLNYDSNMKFTEKFDHYNVYHYYNNGNMLLNDTEVSPNSTISCVGDSGLICPQNSSSLCFNDGAIACLTELSSTYQNNDTESRLVQTTISCSDSRDPACQGNNSTLQLMIPCSSIYKVYTNTSYLINNFTSFNGTIRYYRTINIINNTNLTSRLSVPREFCVTILLLPGEKLSRSVPKKRKLTGIRDAKGYSTLPKYSYSTKLAENRTLGYYLVHRLNSLRYPSFYFMNALVQEQDGSIQLYDHLSVHHYYDGKEIIPEFMDLQASSLVVCQGDSGIMCPSNTSVLCLNDGSIMCVTDLLLTESCSKGPYCVKSIMPCKNLNAPKCKGVTRIHITMPCISILTVYGDIMSVDNVVYRTDKNSTISYVDLHPKTDSYKSQLFCVSIILLPEKRKITEGEKMFDVTRSIFGEFAIKILGIS